jgi:hypothetical protein
LTEAPVNFQERIRSAAAETLGLGYADIIAQIIHLRVTLDDQTTFDEDVYRINGEYAFLAWELHPHLAMNQLSQEPVHGTAASLSVLEYGGVRERAALKAMNCRWQLENLDAGGAPLAVVNTSGFNSSGQKALDVRLSSLWQDAGGKPIGWCKGNDVMPLIVGPLDRLQGSFELVNSTDDRLNKQTEYGVALWGAFVRARAL